MSIHENIIRARIEHGATNLQDAYRLAWMKDIPRHLRRNGTQASKLNVQHQKEAGAKGAANAKAEAQARRPALLRKIGGYLDQGMNATDIARQIGMPPRTVRRLVREINPREDRRMPDNTPEQHEALMLHVGDLRSQGLSWEAIGTATGWSRDRTRKQYQAWEARQ